MEICPKCGKTVAACDAVKDFSNEAHCRRCGAIIKKRKPKPAKK